jgi:acetyl esterase/lipase
LLWPNGAPGAVGNEDVDRPTLDVYLPPPHLGSRYMLLGPHPDPRLVQSLSNELQVTAQTPPTFLFDMADDKIVPGENSVLFYMALLKAGVPAELHVYEKGNHGCALARTDPVLSSWTKRLADWMKVQRLLKPSNNENRVELQAGK